MSEQDLQSWLNANKLSKIFDTLKENDMETLDDIKELETVEEITELAQDMKLKIGLRKKFVKAVTKLNNITTTPQKPSPAAPSKPGANSNDDEEEKQSHFKPEIAQKLAKHMESMQTVMQKMKQQKDKIQEYEHTINANKDYEYKVYVNKERQIPNNGSFYTTTCLCCNYTCHRGCPYPDNSQKARCNAMDSNGNCRVCPNRCHWSMHKNLPYTVEWYKVEETRTTQAMKDKYDDAKRKQSEEQQKLAGIMAEFDRIQQSFNALMN